MKNTFELILILLIFFFLSSAFVIYKAFNSTGAPEIISRSDAPVKTISQNKLTITTSATNPPMEYISDRGNLVGFDIDLATRIAQELGLSPIIINTPRQFLFDSLDNGTTDIIISSIDISLERNDKYSYSNSYLSNLNSYVEPQTKNYGSQKYVIAVNKNNTEMLSNINETINTLNQRNELELLKQKWLTD